MQEETIILISDNDEQDIGEFLSRTWESVQRMCIDECHRFESLWADVCILDAGHDIEKGFIALEQIKEHHNSLPIIFLTNVSSENIVIRVFRLGAREYFVNPVNLKFLHETIQKLLNVKQKVREKRTAYVNNGNSNGGSYVDKPDKDMPTSIMRAIRYMENNLSENVTVDDISRAANLSRYHFSRIFKRTTGLSPKRFLSQMRIEEAKQLLTGRDSKVSSIAAEVGFQDFSSFTRHFKHFEGVTPSEFKRTQRS